MDELVEKEPHFIRDILEAKSVESVLQALGEARGDSFTDQVAISLEAADSLERLGELEKAQELRKTAEHLRQQREKRETQN